jgi:NitT/TauT family transport system permease protein
MSANDLSERVPDFEKKEQSHARGAADMSAIVKVRGAKGAREAVQVFGLAVLVVGGLELLLLLTNTPDYVFPRPSAILVSLVQDFSTLFWEPLLVTMQTFFYGLAIGSSIGLTLAALLTLRPAIEKLISPYIVIMVTTPMIALVPFLMLQMGFGIEPRVVAVALASGPMVMLNSATGFKQTNAALLALGSSYGASTFQMFSKIRFPLALPMIIVGFMVGSIFGLLTAVGAEMVGGGAGLGSRLVYFSSLIEMPRFGAVLVIIATFGVTIYAIFTLIAKKWTSWQA